MSSRRGAATNSQHRSPSPPPLTPPLPPQPPPSTPPSRSKRDAARANIQKVFSKIITARREAGERHDDMLQCFMDSEYKDGA